MKKTIIEIVSLVISVFLAVALYYIGVNDGEKNKEYELAQRLCKYAEYDFCSVETYQIKFKKGR